MVTITKDSFELYESSSGKIYYGKPGPRGPRLCLSEESNLRRQNIQKYLWKARGQLLRAYNSNNPKRIARAKLRLAKLLLEICDSKDLGPVFPFKWGKHLEVYIELGMDPILSPADFHTKDWYGLARRLETHAMEILYSEADIDSSGTMDSPGKSVSG